MAQLRKKYFSLSSGTMIDVPIGQNSTFDATDIGSATSSSESIRMIPFEDFLDTGTLGELISDLLYNDAQINSEATKVASLLSDGVFRNVENEFKILPIKYVNFGGENYIKKFAILDGQIKYDDNVYLKKATRIGKAVNGTVGTFNLGVPAGTIDISLGDTVSSTSIDFGAQVTAKSATGVTLSEQINFNLSVGNGDTVFFSNPPVAEIATSVSGVLNFENITTVEGGLIVSGTDVSGVYPRFRRDLIEFDVTNSEFIVQKGTETSTRPPVNTQIDSVYQILKINWLSGTTHRVYLKLSNRNFNEEFNVSDLLKIRKTDLNKFDGDWVITNKGTDIFGFYLDVTIPEFRSSANDQNTIGGIIDIDRSAVYSVLLFKPLPDSPTLIADEITLISAFSGLSSSVVHISAAEVSPDNDGFYGIKTRDVHHPVDSLGRLLDWEFGQDKNIIPQLASKYNEEDIDQIAESQIPFPDYEPINKGPAQGNFTTVPFIINSINDNVFNTNEIDIFGFSFGIQNDPRSLGSEGIDLKISTADPIFSQPKLCKNGIPTVNSLSDPDVNFLDPIYNLSIDDFVLITEGAGRGQIAKITSFGVSILFLEGLSKPIDDTSRYLIFKTSTITDVVNGSTTISPVSIANQVLSGVTGKFGPFNAYRKVLIPFSGIFPKINLEKHYFVRLKGQNSGVSSWDRTPSIVIESPVPRPLGDNGSYSPFVEVFYRTIEGYYPSGDFLIEDEFGDISIANQARTLAPHFRPARYQVTAKGLDYAGELVEPLSEDTVFVDVHTGRVKFKSGSEPRRIYLSYYKYDSLSGSSTDFSIKHQSHNDIAVVNTQDKINEIDERFENGAVFKRPTVFNGIQTSFPSDGFKGPFKVDRLDNFKLDYGIPTFDNHDIDSENYIAKFSNHYYDTISRVDKNGIYITNDEFSIRDINTSGTIATSIDFVDASPVVDETVSGVLYTIPASGVTLSPPGINFYDEVIVPAGDVIDVDITFKKKKWSTGIEDTLEFNPGLAFLDRSAQETVSGGWNDLYNDSFGKFHVVRGLMRKGYTESLPYPVTPDIRRRFKQREVIRTLTDQLRSTGTGRSTGRILSERYLTKQKVLSSAKVDNNFIYAVGENTKISQYEFLKKISDNNIVSENIQNYHARVINGSLYTAYVDPTTSPVNNLILEIRDLEKTSNIETDEVNSLTAPRFTTQVTNFSNGVVKVKIVDFDEQNFALVYIYNDSVKNRGIIEIRNKATGEILANSQQEFTNPDLLAITADGSGFFDATSIGDEKIAIVWKKSASFITLKVYNYSVATASGQLTEEVSIENSVDMFEPPKISKFSRDKFVVAYSSSQGLQIKMYDALGELVFFDENQTISSRVITDTTFAANEYNFDLKELPNNNIIIVYLVGGDVFGTVDYEFRYLDEWTKTLTDPVKILIGQNTTERPRNTSVFYTNEDTFIISYLDLSDNKIKYIAYSRAGIKCQYGFIETATNRARNITIPATEHGFFTLYDSNSTSLNFDFFEWRPDFTREIKKNNDLIITTTGPNLIDLKTLPIGDGKEVIMSSQGADAGFRILNTLRDSYQEDPSYFTTGIETGGSNVTNLDAIYVKYQGTSSLVDVLIVSYLLGTDAKVKIFRRDANSWVDLTATAPNELILTGTYTSCELFHLGREKVIFAAQEGTTIRLHTINLDVVDASNGSVWATNVTTTSFLSNANAINITADAGDKFEFLKIRTIQSNVDVFSLFYKSGGDVINSIFLNSPTWTTVELPAEYITVETVTTIITAAEEYSITDIINLKDKKVFVTYTDSNFFLRYTWIEFNSSATFTNFVLGFDATGRSIDNSQTFHNISSYSLDDIETVGTTFLSGTDYKTIHYNAIGDSQIGTIQNIGTTNVSGTLSNYRMDDSGRSISFINDIDTVYSAKFDNFPASFSLDSERIRQNDFSVSGTIESSLLNGIKLGGVDFRGEPITKTAIYDIDTTSLSSYQYEDDIYISKTLEASVDIVSIVNDRVTLILHHSGDTEERNSIQMRHYVIARNRFFPDSDWLPSFDSSYGPFINNLYVKSVGLIDNTALSIWVNPITGGVQKSLITDGNVSVGGSVEAIGFSGSTSNSVYSIIGLKRIIENWIGCIVYDAFSNQYWTILFDPTGEIIFKSEPFTILQFDRRRNMVSDVSITPFGYFIHLYINGAGEYNYVQHGWNGDQYGSLQIIGRNYIEAIDSTPGSFIETSVLKTIEKSSKVRRVSLPLEDEEEVRLNSKDLFIDIQNGVYDIWVTEDPLISGKAFMRLIPTIDFTLISNSSMLVNTDTDGKLCLIKTGDVINLKNRTGSAINAVVVRNT